jgi:hypothetical protein
MQKRTNILLLISFVILSLASTVVYFTMHGDASQEVDTSLFRVDDFTTIDRIVMSGSRHEVQLKFANSRWLVNDQYPADRNLIDVLFATLQQVVPKRPVAARIQDSVSRELEEMESMWHCTPGMN